MESQGKGRGAWNNSVQVKTDAKVNFRATTELDAKRKNESSRPTKEDIRHAFSTHDRFNKTPGFSSVAAAFDFEHHVGSDPALELDVLKSILLREGFLTQIDALVSEVMKPEAYPGENPDYQTKCGTIIELLAQTRVQSITIIESIQRWRGGRFPPPPFVWQNTNYLLKMCRDLDYLSQVSPLVQLLGVSSDAMRHNPLMLENTLDDPPSEEGPEEPEVVPLQQQHENQEGEDMQKEDIHDEGAAINEEEKEKMEEVDQTQLDETRQVEKEDSARAAEKARLREAENVLVLEEEAQRIKVEQQAAEGSMHMSSTYRGSGTAPHYHHAEQIEEQAVSILNWYEDAQAQLQRLREPMSTKTDPRDTGRMDIPKRDRLVPMDTSSAQRSRDILDENRKLTDYLSNSPVLEKKKKARNKAKLKSLNSGPYGTLTDHVSQQTSGFDKSSHSVDHFPDSQNKTRTSTPEKSSDVAADILQAGAMEEEVEFVVRPMSASVRVPLTSPELDELLALEQPSEAIAVVAASVLILLQPGNEVPTDVRWSAFTSLDKEPFLASLTNFNVGGVPKFKLRALRRFLSVDAFNPVALAQNGSLPAAKLAVWVLRVIAAHPEGATYMKEVRGALNSWDTAQRDAEEEKRAQAIQSQQPLTKKKKKKKKVTTKKVLNPVERLLDDVKRAGEIFNKNVIAELKNSLKVKLQPNCNLAVEAATILLEPKKKASVDTLKHAMTKAVGKGEPTFEHRIRDYGLADAEAVIAGGFHGVRRVSKLQCYLEDEDLETDKLKYSSLSIAVVMTWVRSVAALVIYLHDEAMEQQEEERKQDRAATKVQSLERKNQAKKKVERRRIETQAATRIQTRARMMLAKFAVKRRKEEIEERKTAEAATKIQAVARRDQAKVRMDEVRKESEVSKNKVAIEYDNADAERSAPKEIFAIGGSSEKEEKDDYDGDGYDDDYYSEEDEEEKEEEEEKVEAKVEEEEEEVGAKVEEEEKEEEKIEVKVEEEEKEEEKIEVKVEEEEEPMTASVSTPEKQPPVSTPLVSEDGEEEEEKEVLSPLRDPPVDKRKEMQSAKSSDSYGESYGESDFEDDFEEED